MNIIRIPTKHFNDRKKDAIIDTIIIHHTALNTSKEVFNVFQNPKTEVSSHYLIDRDGTIYQFVDEVKKAWHAGVSFWENRKSLNDYSIGIELDNNGSEEFTAPLMESLVHLCKDIMSRHPIQEKYILGHGDIAVGRKVDPSELFDWKFLADNGIGFFPVAIDYTPKILHRYKDEGKKIYDIKAKLCHIGYHFETEIDDTYDKKTDVVIKAFKRHYSQETYDLEGWDTLADARLDELYKYIHEAI